MNAKMQEWADKFTRKGLRTRIISYERERFEQRGHNIHIDRETQVRHLHAIRKLYKFSKTLMFQIGNRIIRLC